MSHFPHNTKLLQKWSAITAVIGRIHYIVAVEPFAWYLWVIAALLLLIPLFGVQRFIVTNIMQMSYKEFVLNAKDSITGKRKINWILSFFIISRKWLFRKTSV